MPSSIVNKTNNGTRHVSRKNKVILPKIMFFNQEAATSTATNNESATIPVVEQSKTEATPFKNYRNHS